MYDKRFQAYFLQSSWWWGLQMRGKWWVCRAHSRMMYVHRLLYIASNLGDIWKEKKLIVDSKFIQVDTTNGCLGTYRPDRNNNNSGAKCSSVLLDQYWQILYYKYMAQWRVFSNIRKLNKLNGMKSYRTVLVYESTSLWCYTRKYIKVKMRPRRGV
jgi:hypothetical protein